LLTTRYFFVNEFSPYEVLFNKYPHEECYFKKDDYLCKLNEPFTKIFYIKDGLTKVSVMHKNGDEKITGFWGRGGIYPLICTEQDFVLEYSIMQKAISDVKAIAFTTDTIRKMMDESPGLCREMVDHYCKFTNLLFFCATTQTYETVITRICNILYLYVKNLTNTNNMVFLNQYEIAALIGATRVAVVKGLKQLRDDGIIETYRHKIVITNLKKLEFNCTGFV